METNLLMAAVGVQMILTLSLYLLLLKAKLRANREGTMDAKRVAIHMDGWPDDVVQINNNLTNQYQQPVLFYVLALLAMQLGLVNWMWVGLAWVFVTSRIVHMIEHIGRNKIMVRMRVFVVGTVSLSAMILYLLVGVFSQ